jgi:hypothetical protein
MLALCAAGCLAYVLVAVGLAPGGSGPFGGGGPGPRADVLVLYVFAHTDPDFLENLKYFVREAVGRDPGVCDYLIAVHRSHGLEARGAAARGAAEGVRPWRAAEGGVPGRAAGGLGRGGARARPERVRVPRPPAAGPGDGPEAGTAAASRGPALRARQAPSTPRPLRPRGRRAPPPLRSCRCCRRCRRARATCSTRTRATTGAPSAGC